MTSNDQGKHEAPASAPVMVSALSAVLGGGITVAQNLTENLARLRPDRRFDLYCSHDAVAGHAYPDNVRVVQLPELQSRRARWRWEQMGMPAVAAENGYGVVLLLGGYLSFRTAAPQVAVWQNPNVFTPPGIRRPPSERILVAIQRHVQSASMKRAAQNVFLTHNSVELASRWWDMDRIRHCVIHSGVDLENVVAKDPVPLEDREPFALAVGHTYSHKNYEAMIDAMDEYRRRFDEPLALRIIGAPANPGYFAALERRIREKNLTEIVTMPGPASSQEVLSMMSRAKVYLVTSLLETFGLTMFEAMGQGLPVLASDATCHPEVVGDAGLYCDPRDPGQIATQLRRLVTDPLLAADLRQRGFNRVREFSWSNSAARYLEVLEGVAGSQTAV